MVRFLAQKLQKSSLAIIPKLWLSNHFTVLSTSTHEVLLLLRLTKCWLLCQLNFARSPGLILMKFMECYAFRQGIYFGSDCLRGYLILIKYAVVIVIWILASLFWNTVYIKHRLGHCYRDSSRTHYTVLVSLGLGLQPQGRDLGPDNAIW